MRFGIQSVPAPATPQRHSHHPLPLVLFPHHSGEVLSPAVGAIHLWDMEGTVFMALGFGGVERERREREARETEREARERQERETEREREEAPLARGHTPGYIATSNLK